MKISCFVHRSLFSNIKVYSGGLCNGWCWLPISTGTGGTFSQSQSSPNIGQALNNVHLIFLELRIFREWKKFLQKSESADGWLLSMVCIFWKVSNEKSWGSGLDTIIETNSGVVVKCKCDGGMPNTKATTISTPVTVTRLQKRSNKHSWMFTGRCGKN